MKKDKQTKTARIQELERKLEEALASQAHMCGSACSEIVKAGPESLLGSGAILTLTALGGRQLIKPVLIRDGLSKESITALQADFARSFDLATLHRPKGSIPLFPAPDQDKKG